MSQSLVMVLLNIETPRDMQRILRILKSALKGEEKDFTTGSINRALVLLAIPMILEMLMESLFAVVDAFFVSRIGTNAVATIGLTESVITIVYSMAIGLSMAATAMVARRIGEKDPEGAAKAAAQAINLSVAVAIILGILGAVFAPNILRWMGADESVVAEGVTYTRIMLGGNVVIILLFLLNGVFRGAGDASLAMRSLTIANLINIVLDPLLIFGVGPFPELGVTGAAVATTIGRGIGVAYQLSILFGKASLIKLRRPHFKFDPPVIRRLSDIAATGAGQFIIASASWIFLMRIIALFGSSAVAGYTIAIRLIVSTILPSMGIANAAATLVGQNLGAKQPQRAEISTWRAAHFNTAFLISVSFVYLIFAPSMLRLFSPDPEVIRAGVATLRIICAGYVVYGYAMVLGAAFNGAGDTRTPTAINFVCFWLIQIPLGYFLAVTLKFGLPGVCWSVVISETLMVFLLIFLFRRGKWKTVKV